MQQAHRPGIKRSRVTIEGTKNSVFHVARSRVVLISSLFAFFYGIILLRLIDLSIVQTFVFPAQMSLEPDLVISQPIAQTEISQKVKNTHRIDVVDRNGHMLATTLPVNSLYADPRDIVDAATTAKALVDIFPDLSESDVRKKLDSERSFIWVKRHLTPTQIQQVLLIGDPGLNFKRETRRFYPQSRLTAHVVGYTNVDGMGLAGVEKSYNDDLLKPSRDEKPLSLTIDIRLQHILRDILMNTVDEFKAKGAAGVIADVHTGELLSLVSLPDFDPNDMNTATENAIFNRFTNAVYEPGSTFKIFSSAAYLEKSKHNIAHKFDASKPIKRGGFTIEDYHAENRFLTFPEAFIHSSNIGSALMGEYVGTDVLRDTYGKIGLLDQVPLNLSGTAKPLVPSPWRDINTLTASYGHGIAVTPLHTVLAGMSVVNGGMYMKPQIVMPDKDTVTITREGQTVFQKKTSDILRKTLRLAVTDGTGQFANVNGYVVGGKTGTSEKIVGGRYDQKKLMSSFIGFFPMNNPKYAIYVLVDEPVGLKKTAGYATGGWVAAPAVAKVVKAMATLYGIPKENIDDDKFLSDLRTLVTREEDYEEEMASY